MEIIGDNFYEANQIKKVDCHELAYSNFLCTAVGKISHVSLFQFYYDFMDKFIARSDIELDCTKNQLGLRCTLERVIYCRPFPDPIV